MSLPCIETDDHYNLRNRKRQRVEYVLWYFKPRSQQAEDWISWMHADVVSEPEKMDTVMKTAQAHGLRVQEGFCQRSECKDDQCYIVAKENVIWLT